jgi:2-oxoglutarate dehydrogenase E1 component
MTSKRMKESYSQNITFIENLYTLWKKNPESLEPGWRDFFRSIDDKKPLPQPSPQPQISEESSAVFREKQAAVQSLIDRFRESGHILANVDPLSPAPTSHPALNLNAFRLSEPDFPKTFNPRKFPRKEATLEEIYAILSAT